MDQLSVKNQMRRLAGLSVDYMEEARIHGEVAPTKKVIMEARKVPGRKHQVAEKTPENLRKCVDQAEKALDHVEEAIKCLERIPAIDFDGVVPHMIEELEAVLTDDGDGVSLNSAVAKIQKMYRVWRREENATSKIANDADETMRAHEEEEEVQRRMETMKDVLHVGSSSQPKMTKKGNTIDGWVSNLASDTETEVTIEFDYSPGQSAQTNPDAAGFGPEESQEVEVYQITTADGQEIDPNSVELEDVQDEILQAIQSQDASGMNEGQLNEDHFKVGQKVKDTDGKDWKITSIDNEGDGDKEVYHVKCTKSGKTKTFKPSQLNESMHFYNDSNYEDWEDDKSKPVNVADGSSNADQVWDEPMDPENDRDESPHQMADPMSAGTSPQDQSVGDEATIKIPAKIKSALQDEIDEARAEAKKLDVHNKDASYFYNDLANAFEDLLNHIKGGTRGDIKQAQMYMTSLMGPMLHKVPATVVNFLANGGERRSLKDYYKPVDKKYPITGPRNVLK